MTWRVAALIDIGPLGRVHFLCLGCCGYVSSSITPNPGYGGVGQFESTTVWGNNGCTGMEDVTRSCYGWSSTNTAVSTVDSSGLVDCRSAGSATIQCEVDLEGTKLPNCAEKTFSPTRAMAVCDFTIDGAPQPATCDGKTKNETTFEAFIKPDSTTCPVFANGSSLTFRTDGVKVDPDYNDSYQSYQVLPTMYAYYWVYGPGGTITPEFTIAFGPTSGAKVEHDEILSVPCR